MFEDALLKDIPYRLHNLTREASITLLVRLLPAPLWFIRTSQPFVLPFENALNLLFAIHKCDSKTTQLEFFCRVNERVSIFELTRSFSFSGETMTGMDNLGYDAAENAVSGWIFVINAELDYIKIPFLLLYYKLTNKLIMELTLFGENKFKFYAILSSIYWSNLQLYIDQVFMQIWTGVECKFS